MDFMEIKDYQCEAAKDFEVLQKKFKNNFDHLNEEELKIFRAKVFELIDLLRDKKRQNY